ncbi:MAG: hypothetical protein ABSE48_18180 [Verrucomicrobiota bacterium]|jgi:hypothetical protein
MKLTRTKKILALALVSGLADGIFAGAQSNDVPGDTDYGAFSHFITQRNIFDPGRYPHEVRSARPQRRTHSFAPAFTLVGTMTYGKGVFAFFNGNNDELQKVLKVNGIIAGYTVTDITMTGATLRGPDKKDLTLRIGNQMRQENNGWQLIAQADAAADSVTVENSSSQENNSSAGSDDSQPAAPSATLSSNEVLKRLMQLREQENK